jgi:transcriptional regulator with XRE-family HTH domain
MQIVPRRSRLKLPPVKFGEDESLGQRIGRLRKERAITQQELAERIGTIQVLVSDYERDRIRVTAEMVVRIAEALELSADELLGMKAAQAQRRIEGEPPRAPSRRARRGVTASATGHAAADDRYVSQAG